MKKRSLLLASVLSLFAFALRAEPVTLSRSEAFELHTALSQLQPGLSPENTLAAADDLNTLEPAAKSFRQGYAKLLQLQQTADTTKNAEDMKAFREADAKFAAATDEKKVYELTILTITKEDVKAANLSVTTVATIKRLLKADPKPETKK